MTISLSNYYFRTLSATLWSATACLWIIYFFFNPYAQPSFIPPHLIALFTVSVLGIFFCYAFSPILLIILSAISLLPIGLYLIATIGLFSLIGVLNLANLVYAIAALQEEIDRNNGVRDSGS
jgi:hypothetical protein